MTRKHYSSFLIVVIACVIFGNLAYAQQAPIPNPPAQQFGVPNHLAQPDSIRSTEPKVLNRTQWNSRPTGVWMSPEQRQYEIEAERQQLMWKNAAEREYKRQAELVKFQGRLARQQLGNNQAYYLQNRYGLGEGGGFGYYWPNAGYGGYSYIGNQYYSGYGPSNWTNPYIGYGYVGQGYNR